jgi:hypothetical protein
VLQVWCHSTAGSGAGARAIAGQVRAALLNVRPTISGRSCWPIRKTDGSPMGRDETLGIPVMSKVDVFELKTAPG